ncbi:carboxypeptidase regulatory-like domain-containing protein [Halorubrum sp. FL23]|uniref:carboxypeptidase regulatory-like domain-containing protein n=1 Tax=Halorubrum sp. FL23 TaxID=3458704 RepID=UPI0040331AFD
MIHDKTRDQVRAVFLAVVMIVSVFGGTMAFAGTAAAQTEATASIGSVDTITDGDTQVSVNNVGFSNAGGSVYVDAEDGSGTSLTADGGETEVTSSGDSATLTLSTAASESDTVNVVVYESSGPTNELVSDSNTVQAAPTGSVSVSSPIAADDSEFTVDVSNVQNTEGDNAYLVVTNSQGDSETFTVADGVDTTSDSVTITQADSSGDNSAAFNLVGSDSVDATLYESSSESNQLDTGATTVDAGASASVTFSSGTQDVSNDEVSVDISNLQNVQDGNVDVLVVNQNGASDGQTEEIVGSSSDLTAGDGQAVTLGQNTGNLNDQDTLRVEVHEINSPTLDDSPLDTDTATAERPATGSIGSVDTITDGDTQVSVNNVGFSNAGGSVYVDAEDGSGTSLTADGGETEVTSSGDSATLTLSTAASESDTVNVVVYESSSLSTSLASNENTVQAAPTGSFAGTVSDSNGALDSVAVTLTSGDSTIDTTVTTNADGTYTVSDVPIGTYQVSATADGYETTSTQEVQISQNSETSAVDFTLTESFDASAITADPSTTSTSDSAHSVTITATDATTATEGNLNEVVLDYSAGAFTGEGGQLGSISSSQQVTEFTYTPSGDGEPIELNETDQVGVDVSNGAITLDISGVDSSNKFTLASDDTIDITLSQFDNPSTSGDYDVDVELTDASDNTDTASTTVNIGARTGSVTFSDQALGQNDSNSAVLVESVDTNVDSTVLVTYTNESGDEVIAGLEDVDSPDGENVVVEIGNASGFPGEHTAHVVPDDSLSGDYSVDDTVSDDTSGSALGTDTATVLETDLVIENQSYADPTTDVTVANATVRDGGDDTTGFTVNVNDGSSGPLTGENTDVTVSGITEIGETTEVTAELSSIQAVDGDAGFVAVNDTATVTITGDAAQVDTINATNDFAGIVQDDDELGVTAAGIADANGNVLPSGTVTVEIADGDTVLHSEEASVTEGEIDTTIDTTQISSNTDLGTAEVRIAADTETTDEVELVHEAFSAPNSGYFLTSVPQPATVHTENISDETQYDAAEDSYVTLDDSNEVATVNRALYLNADSADARYGFAYDTDRANQPGNFGSATLDEGWHVLGSNFDTSDTELGGEIHLSEDLNTQNPPESSQIVVQDTSLSGATLSNTAPIGEHDVYYVYVHEGDNRPIVLSEYTPDDRDTVLSS